MNPRTVSLPDAAPIDPALKDDFLRTAAPLLTQLDRTPPGRERTTADEKPAKNLLKTAGQGNDIRRR